MAHSISAKKRIRQNTKQRARNRARKKEIKVATRSFTEAMSTGDGDKAQQALKDTIKKIDRVAAKGSIHKNTAARKKSKLQRQLNALKTKG
ncbi:MAG: 30S ribosomal protein S20 [Planctomycetota bacterium]|nr:MAG: 30S ribosomal protein S20 [Planctomycetota bacterium]